MPARRKHPYPPERMVELLVDRKREVLAAQGYVTEQDFEDAWALSWAMMVTERAWPHATAERRGWRKAMLEAMRPEAKACFLGVPSGFQRYARAVLEAQQNAGEPDDLLAGELVA